MTQTTAPIAGRQFLREDPAPLIAREGWPIVFAFVLVSVLVTWGAYALLGWVAMAAIGVIGAVLTLWCIWFFRDPRRSTPSDPSLVIAPADGVVVLMGPAKPPPELALRASQEDQMQRVCIFMNVFNVHVNRAPVSGVVVASHYHPGKFLNASLDKASEHNERSSLAMRTAEGHVVAFVQIAGLIARRIISRAKEGDPLRAGQRYGLIRFGSRVDVYLPKGSVISVSLNQKTVAGETVIASLPKAPAG